MKLFLKRKNGVDAVANYNLKTGELTVLKGSHVSNIISKSTKFRGVNSVILFRSEYVKNCVTIRDITFKSSSTAANFVTGTSTNGLAVWKNGKGDKLGTILKKS
jgi:hypothetical protein